MNEIILDSFGKINLALDVLAKRDDEYHEISTIMQQIDLKDKVILRDKQDEIKIECNHKNVPLDNTNLAYKAWEKIVDKTGVKRGIHIIIEKRIPVSAGLAGGSSNAAAVLKGLNTLWDLNLSQEELMQIGSEIGADIPFCIMGGTAWGQGIGERLTKIKSFSNKMILLANIGMPISTADVYNNLDLDSKKSRVDIEKTINYIEEDNLLKVTENMINVMETVVVDRYPIIGEIKKDMMRHGALGSIMSGSGPTVFGIFNNQEKLYRSKKELGKKVKKVIVAKTI